jgi:hypothetical protein
VYTAVQQQNVHYYVTLYRSQNIASHLRLQNTQSERLRGSTAIPEEHSGSDETEFATTETALYFVFIVNKIHIFKYQFHDLTWIYVKLRTTQQRVALCVRENILSEQERTAKAKRMK